MGTKTEEINIHLKGKDESKSAFESAFANIKHLNQESRASGEMAFERLLKGGGALGLASLVAEQVEKAAESARKALDELGSSDGRNAAVAAASLQALVDSNLLGIGTLTKAFGAVEDLGQDFTARLAVTLGAATEEQGKTARSAATLKEQYERLGKVQEHVTEIFKKAIDEARIAAAKGVHKKLIEEEVRFQDEMAKLRKDEYEKLKNLKPEDAKTVEATYGELFKSLTRKHEDREKDINREFYEATEKEEATHQQRMRDILASAAAERLKDSGRELEAELLKLREENQKAVQEVKERAEKRKDRDPENRDKIKADAESEIRGLDDRLRQQIDVATRAHNLKKEDEERGHQQQIKDIETQAQADRLQRQGQETEAFLLGLRARHDKEIEEINREVKRKTDALAQNHDATAGKEIARLEAEATKRRQAVNDLVRQEEGKALEERDKKQGDRQQGLNHEAAQARIELLQELGGIGNELAKQEAERLGLAEKYEQKREDINRRLRDEKDLTSGERAQLEDRLKQLTAEEKIAKRIAAIRETRESSGPPELQESRFLVGIAQSQQETRQLDLAQQSADALKDIFEQNKMQTDAQKKIVENTTPPTITTTDPGVSL